MNGSSQHECTFFVINHFRISNSLHDLLAFDFLFAISAFSDKINDEQYN